MRAGWVCWSCRNTSHGRIGSSGGRSAAGWIASAASPRHRRKGARDGAACSHRMLRFHQEQPVRISLAKSNVSFSVAPDQSLLDAALAASLNLPHSCKGGNCGSCRARLLHGEGYYPNCPPLGLSDAEMAGGLVLLCQARARSDLSIETYEITAADQARVKRLPARIERAVP